MWDRLLRFLRQFGLARKSQSQSAGAEDGRWIDASESPTGRPLLDLMEVMGRTLSFTTDQTIAERWARLSHSDGSDVRGTTIPDPIAIPVAWEFAQEETAKIRRGTRALTMEDKWMSDCYDDKLYLRRSWTGDLQFMTDFQLLADGSARINVIWTPKEGILHEFDPDYIAGYVRFLIDAYALSYLRPFPIPDTTSFTEKNIVKFAFHHAGRRACLIERFTPQHSDLYGRNLATYFERQREPKGPESYR